MEKQGQRESNYEVMKHRMAEEFLKYDISGKIRLWNLETADGFVFLTFVSDGYRVSLKTGLVETKVRTDDGSFTWAEADCNSAMTIYDLLCYAQDLAHPSGDFVPMQALSTVQTGQNYAGKGMYAAATEYFAAHGDAFGRACEALGGQAWGKADYGYKLPVFQGLELSLQLYEADEEFAAQMTVQADRNTLMYMHYETMWFMVGHVLGKVREKMK